MNEDILIGHQLSEVTRLRLSTDKTIPRLSVQATHSKLVKVMYRAIEMSREQQLGYRLVYDRVFFLERGDVLRPQESR